MRAKILSLTLMTAGCGGSNPSLHLLQPAVAAPAPTSGNAAKRAIAVREVILPTYAKDTRLAERGKDGAITHVEDHRWADAPTRTISRTLADNLRAITGATVFVEPWPPQFSPDVLVTIEFDAFDGTRGGSAELVGRLYIVAAGDSSVRSKSFSITTPVAGNRFVDVMVALSKSLGGLARDVVAVGL